LTERTTMNLPNAMAWRRASLPPICKGPPGIRVSSGVAASI
jgi:hypothetical protein